MSKGASHVCVGLCAHCIFVSLKKISSYRLHCTIDQGWLYTCIDMYTTTSMVWGLLHLMYNYQSWLLLLIFCIIMAYYVFYTCFPNYHSLLKCYYNFNILDLVFHMTRWLGVMSHCYAHKKRRVQCNCMHLYKVHVHYMYVYVNRCVWCTQTYGTAWMNIKVHSNCTLYIIHSNLPLT